MVQITTTCQSTCSPWAAPSDIGEPCNAGSFNPDLLVECLQAASDTLFLATANLFAGICQDTVRPSARWFDGDVGRPVAGGYRGGWWGGTTLNGVYSPFGFCGCNVEKTGCNVVPAVSLGVYPIDKVTEVKVDGVVLDPSEYTVQDKRFLVRMADPVTKAPRGWPCCQRRDLPATDVGTWQVRVVYGTMPPPLGKLAAAELACQLSMLLKPSQAGDCQIAPGAIVTNMSRAGESMVVLDPMVLIREGFQGLPICDRFIKSINPHGAARRAAVLSPDIGERVWRDG